MCGGGGGGGRLFGSREYPFLELFFEERLCDTINILNLVLQMDSLILVDLRHCFETVKPLCAILANLSVHFLCYLFIYLFIYLFGYLFMYLYIYIFFFLCYWQIYTYLLTYFHLKTSSTRFF